MKYFDYLKNSFLVYIIAGTALGIAIFSFIIIHRYSNYLNSSLDEMRAISNNKARVMDEITRIEKTISYLKETIDVDTLNTDPDILFFHTLDGIKTEMKGASIVVSGFKETGDKKILPLAIVVPVKNYEMIIDYTGYLESFRLPRYRIKNLSISGDNTGNVVFNIQGELIAPVMKN
jgi:hypothetical protein